MPRSVNHALTFFAVCLLCATAAYTAVVSADKSSVSPEELIRDMSQALTDLNYEGSFVHMQNGNIESMSIVHSNDNGGELEYMLSLNGEAREVFRNRSLVTCIWPTSKSVIVSDSKSRKMLPHVDESLTNGETYQLTMGQPDRVAGIDAHVVDIKPKDQFRYGYRFWVDKKTNMLLRSMLVGNDGATVEQVMFTNITYPESIPKERFATPGVKTETYKTSSALPTNISDDKNRVDFSSLPAGYAEVSETYKPMLINDRPVSHVMLSDGMASVSVYVEYIAKADHTDVTIGMSTMGAMNAYTRSLDDALITVVGEVPSATVETIARAVLLLE